MKKSLLYNTLGFIYYYLGNTEKRLEVNLLSLELRTKNKETVEIHFLNRNNTRDTYIKLNKPKKALSLLANNPDIESQDLNLKQLYMPISEKLLCFLNFTKKQKKN